MAASKQKMCVVGAGEVKISIVVDPKEHEVTICNALYGKSDLQDNVYKLNVKKLTVSFAALSVNGMAYEIRTSQL